MPDLSTSCSNTMPSTPTSAKKRRANEGLLIFIFKCILITLDRFDKADAEYFLTYYVKDKKCTLCKSSLTSTKPYNVGRHFFEKHAEKHAEYFEAKNQSKAVVNQPKISEAFRKSMSDPMRSFVLYAATSTFPREHLLNSYLIVPISVFCLSNFKI